MCQLNNLNYLLLSSYLSISECIFISFNKNQVIRYKIPTINILMYNMHIYLSTYVNMYVCNKLYKNFAIYKNKRLFLFKQISRQTNFYGIMYLFYIYTFN